MRGLAIYTGLRLALLAAVWLVVQLVTPWRGLLAIAVAVAVSGVIGFFVLDRTRDSASESVWRVFRGIDDRIKRNEMLEDALVEATYGADASTHPAVGPESIDSQVRETTEVLSTEGSSAGRQRQTDSEQDPVDAGQDPAEGQDGDEITAGGAIDHDEPGAHSQG